jgi:preprotein translocase subunit SecD
MVRGIARGDKAHAVREAQMNILKSVRVLFLLFCIAVSALLITNIIPLNKGKGIGFGNGLDYGLDFAGGTQMQLKLETPVTTEIMAVEKGILENRLNSMGLKDIPVRPWGDQYLIIQIADATPEQTAHIENILKQQARFEERIDGALAIKGDEITVDLGTRGTELYRSQGGYSWAVSVNHNKDGACRFGQVADGKRGRPVDIFIDRPENTSVLFSGGDYYILGNLTETGESERFFFGDSALGVLQNRSVIPVVGLFNDSSAVEELLRLRSEGYNRVILAGDESKISDAVRNRLEENDLKTERVPMGNLSYTSWLSKMAGLQSSPRLDFDPHGECVYAARITGSTGTLDAAKLEVQRNQILLTSGNLPAKLNLESTSTTPPTLGRRFLRYSLYTGLIAIIAVAVVISIRYRRIGIVLPVMFTGISEIILILGMAALINWELDLPALAGIIASVGTGVNHQIVITDENLKRTTQKKIVSIAERMRRAFTIIFTAAATVIAAMIPLLGIGAGMLKGFAFTTMMGVFIGVGIARPAYAKIIEEILKTEE